MRADVAVVGGGGAGLSLLLALDRAGLHGLSVVLVDPVRRYGADRTWCFWDSGRSAVEAAEFRAWRSVELVGPDGVTRALDLSPLRYVMVRSPDFYTLAEAAAARLGVARVTDAASEVVDGPDLATVTVGGERLQARWVFDSRPAPPRRAARTALLQQFRGWTLRAASAAFAPERPVLMDFRTPQPPRGLSFGYVLPHDASTALVEYTEISPAISPVRLDEPAYAERLGGYVSLRLGRTTYDVVETETGAIPMTDAVQSRRVGRRVVRLGTAGGATRASTGYTFAAMQRQAGAVAAALRDGRVPVPPPAYPARHRWMDSVLLRALDGGLVPGPELFTQLFERNPPERVLRFLDGATTPAEEVAVMASSPLAAMTRATVEDALLRLRGRVHR